MRLDLTVSRAPLARLDLKVIRAHLVSLEQLAPQVRRETKEVRE